MTTAISMAKNALETRHLMKSDQTPKPRRCQSGVSLTRERWRRAKFLRFTFQNA
jgi:hypothetical protein